MIFVQAYSDESMPGQPLKDEPVPEYAVVAVKCPHLLYQSECESSVDSWFQRG